MKIQATYSKLTKSATQQIINSRRRNLTDLLKEKHDSYIYLGTFKTRQGKLLLVFNSPRDGKFVSFERIWR